MDFKMKTEVPNCARMIAEKIFVNTLFIRFCWFALSHTQKYTLHERILVYQIFCHYYFEFKFPICITLANKSWACIICRWDFFYFSYNFRFISLFCISIYFVTFLMHPSWHCSIRTDDGDSSEYNPLRAVHNPLVASTMMQMHQFNPLFFSIIFIFFFFLFLSYYFFH